MITQQHQQASPATVWETVRRPLVVLVVTAFVLNLVWENAHGVLYDHVIPGWIFLRAAGGDVLLVLLGLIPVIGLRRSPVACIATAAAVLLALATGVEWLALDAGRWEYTDAMPTIGRIGLSPLLQLPVTGIMSLLAADRFGREQQHRAQSTLE